MNTMQKLILCATILILAANVLYPPFHVKTLGMEVKNGRHFVAKAPNILSHPDWTTVGIQCVVVATAGACGFVLAAGRRRRFEI